MSDQSILREYLVALGFKIDQPGQKKFGQGLEMMDKKALGLGKSILGVATATQAMVSLFAYQMEKLYYASKRTDSTVGNIQALEYAGKQIGISGGAMTASLEAMGRALRSQPALAGVLNQLGVRVSGRDRSDVLKDMVTQLSKMPFNVAEQYASMFGMSGDQLFMLIQGREEMEKADAERKQMAADMGIDSEAAALAGKEYANTWGKILMQVGLFKDALSIALLPKMQEIAGVTSAVLKDWTKIVNEISKNGWGDFFHRLDEGIFNRAKPGVQLSKESKDRIAAMQASEAKPGTAPGASAPAAPGKKVDTATLFARLEQEYSLPAGWLDRMWKRESGRGAHLRGPKTKYGVAKGHFQFLDATAAENGVTNPDDLEDAARGAAKYSHRLIEHNHGDARAAAASYNWGMGNVDKFGLGSAPKETRDYMDAVAGPQITQTNHITVTGVSSPQEVADAVSEQLAAVSAETTRNFKPRMQ